MNTDHSQAAKLFLPPQINRLRPPEPIARFLPFYSGVGKTTMHLPSEPWLQLDDESGKAYIAFCVYRDMGPQRSIRKAYIAQLPPYRYTKHGRKRYSRLLPGRWAMWSSKFAWHKRALAFDRHLGVSRIPVPVLRMFHQYLAGHPIDRRRSKAISLD